MARRNTGEALEQATGVSIDHINDRVATAYNAKYGKAPKALSYSNIQTDPEVLGRVHFNVNQSGKKIGSATYKPRHKSVWVNWS